MNNTSYHLPTFGGLLMHFPQSQPVARDVASDVADEADDYDTAKMLVQARIRSGDYFVTLATEIDKMAQGLNTVRAPEAAELERVVSELLYLHDNYRLTLRQP